MTILDQLADYARVRVEKDKEKISLEELKASIQMDAPGNGEAFKSALCKPEMSFICEVKKASPSKGIISEDFPYLDIARKYEDAGADCISCLTEPKWFLGSDKIFTDVRSEVKIPMIRKDFTVDEYQIYQAKNMGANAILLICTLLDTKTIERYLQIAHGLGLVALVETHNEDEIRSAVEAGAGIIGVNNRNLKDFTVDFNNAARLRKLIPDNAIYVAESGVSSVEDAKILRSIGADAALIGEALMRAKDPGEFLQAMKEAAK